MTTSRKPPRADPAVPPDWRPPAGTVHRYCDTCGQWFAARDASPVCQTCRATRPALSASPFDPVVGGVGRGARAVSHRPR